MAVDGMTYNVPVTVNANLTAQALHAQATGAYLDVYDTGGTPNSRRFYVKQSSGALLALARNDNGSSKGTSFFLSWISPAPTARWWGIKQEQTSLTGANYNTLLGYQAGYGITTGSNNLILATATSSTGIANLTTGSQNILIGNNISFASTTANGKLDIGNIIFGTNITSIGTTTPSGNLGIGTTTPYSRLEVWVSTAQARRPSLPLSIIHRPRSSPSSTAATPSSPAP